jgi:Asp-tRNA(Asn)/Glu-tRNA(Gln) amidotransferase A subunit family amidase
MDKLGPICRSVEDCALVLDAIYGPDGKDLSVHDAAFNWNATTKISSLRIGYTKKFFDLPEKDTINGKLETVHGSKAFDDAALDVLRKLGANLIPVEIPDFPYNAMRMMLTVEAAAAFDELTRSGRDKELVQQGPFAWPNSFRSARFTPAVEYVNASRVRTLAMEAWAKLFQTVDVIVTPTSAAGNAQLTATNLTGHPAVIVPNGFRNYDDKDDTQVPVSLTFLGDLFQEAKLMAVASAYQRATPFHLKYPTLNFG